jgi:hypothetical protein
MKKIFTASVMVFSIYFSNAQVTVPKVDTKTVPSVSDFIKPPDIGDIGKTTSSITDLLTSKLSLPGDQKPKLSDAIGGFLKDKKGILGLAGTNPSGYLSKFNPLQKGLFDKMKGIMGAAKFTNFLGLKPSGNNITGNLLSHLFF